MNIFRRTTKTLPPHQQRPPMQFPPHKQETQAVWVYLPHVTAKVLLRSKLAETLKMIIQASETGISTFDLWDAGLTSAAKYVSELRSQGAIINTVRHTAFDWNGRRHPQVAHYVYGGWNAAKH